MCKSPLTILIADDDQDDQSIIKDALTEINCDFLTHYVSNGQEVLKWIRTHGKPDLIVMDLNMPIMDGLGALRQIKTDPVYNKIPVFMLSTSASDKDRLSAKRFGAEDFYTKPNTFTGVKALISEIYTRASA